MTESWGRSTWKTWHLITLSYPQNPTSLDKTKYKNFFLKAGEVLPCLKCRENYQKHLEQLPLTDSVMTDRLSLATWLFNIHNMTNKLLGKKEFSFSDFVDKYSEIKNRKRNSLIKKITAGVIGAVCIAFYITRKKE